MQVLLLLVHTFEELEIEDFGGFSLSIYGL
jgi:hypothetical protein